MSDLLVKLYDLKDDWSFLDEQGACGVRIRKPLGTEFHIVVSWVRQTFGIEWASEADAAMANRPVTCFVAVESGKLVGFACYDATALGFFGPIGVAEACRGRGTGRALLKACMLDMKLKGYGYAIVGMTDKLDFYSRAVGAVEIPGSGESVWRDWVRPQPSACPATPGG